MSALVSLVAIAITLAMPAFAEEVGVHVGPVGAGVTVGSGPDRVREREVIREREPRDKVIVKERHAPTVVEKKKTIIKERD